MDIEKSTQRKTVQWNQNELHTAILKENKNITKSNHMDDDFNVEYNVINKEDDS